MKRDYLLKRKVSQNTIGGGRRNKQFILGGVGGGVTQEFHVHYRKTRKWKCTCVKTITKQKNHKGKTPLALKGIFHVTYANLPVHVGIPSLHS